MTRSIVLLSSGMDSTTALYKALTCTEVVAVMTFDYDQKGAAYEIANALEIHEQLDTYSAIDFLVSKFEMNASSALFNCSHMKTTPGETHWSRFSQKPLPATFVPARNLIMLSLAAATAWTLNCAQIWGGWSSVDTDYPDCSAQFLNTAQNALNMALGLFYKSKSIEVVSPLINMSKMEIVELGESLGVPWNLTRSCYEHNYDPCLTCDSCKLRIDAFLEAGIVDPTVNPTDWELLVDEYQGG